VIVLFHIKVNEGLADLVHGPVVGRLGFAHGVFYHVSVFTERSVVLILRLFQ
jgi:hypothetical protein